MAVLSILLRSICLQPHSTAIIGDETGPRNEGLQNSQEQDQEPYRLLPCKERRRLQSWFRLQNIQPENENQHIHSEAPERKVEAKRAAKETREAEIGRKAVEKRVARERRRAGAGGKWEGDGWQDSQYQRCLAHTQSNPINERENRNLYS